MLYIKLPLDIDKVNIGDIIIFKELNKFKVSKIIKKTAKKVNVESDNYSPSISKMILISNECLEELNNYLNVLNKLL